MQKSSIFLSAGCLLIGVFVGWVLWAPSFGSYKAKIYTNENASKTSMYSMMGDVTKNLATKTGDDFDLAFLDDMIIHHQTAVDMANLAIKNANHQEIKDLAKSIISNQSPEINKMKS